MSRGSAGGMAWGNRARVYATLFLEIVVSNVEKFEWNLFTENAPGFACQIGHCQLCAFTALETWDYTT